MQPAIADPPVESERASAYPPKVDELVPQARELAAGLGEVPSRNRLMAELRIGAPKATALRDLLVTEAESELAEPDPEPTGSGEPAGGSDVGEQGADEVLTVVDGHPEAPPAVEAAADGGASIPQLRPWPLLLLAAPAFVAIWSGWVGLGGLTGFGVVHPLPGIADGVAINSAITLPIGVETYAAFALRAWLSRAHVPGPARRFAKWSAVGSLVLGAAGQVAYHQMAAAGMTAAPWVVTTAVSCLPVAVLGMGAALAGLLRRG
jgi:hypothetical protein